MNTKLRSIKKILSHVPIVSSTVLAFRLWISTYNHFTGLSKTRILISEMLQGNKPVTLVSLHIAMIAVIENLASQANFSHLKKDCRMEHAENGKKVFAPLLISADMLILYYAVFKRDAGTHKAAASTT